MSKRQELEEEFFDNLSIKLEEKKYSQDYNLDDAFTYCALSALCDVSIEKILDLGCGDGKFSCLFSKMGSKVVSIDISLGILSLALIRAKKNNLDNISFLKMSAEALGFKDNRFDAVFGGYLLHHTCVEFAISEAYRILKDGGKAVFIENFAINKLLAFFRKYVAGKFGIPRYGTLTEHPLTYEDIKIMKKSFKIVEIRTLL
ncbi:MAG: class I SAM-dependent methyltransferase [bacterium]|nr:class I SAM-dependent methyltransferase [bacterium]